MITIDPASSQRIASKAIAQVNRRSRHLTRLEFARTVKFAAGDLKGTSYDPASDPIQRWLIQEMDRMDGRRRVWERIYWCGAPQFTGKTFIGIILQALYGTIHERLPVGYALPTLKDIDKAWHTKLWPNLRFSGFGNHMPASGPGSRGGRGHVVQFVDPKSEELEGQIIFCTPGAYGDTCAVMAVDELDQFRRDDMPDMEGLEDLWNRANVYRERALRIGVGTIEWDTNSTILALVEQGTKSQAWLKCPHCQAYQVIDPATQMVHEGDDEATVMGSARIVCSVHGCRWTEDDRQLAIADLRMAHRGQTVGDGGVIDGPVPQTRALSLIEDAFVCPHSRLPELAREDWQSTREEAKGQYGLRRKYVRYRLCRPYVEPVVTGELTTASLAERSKRATYHRREVPPWVQFLTVGCDVQKDRHYWLCMGHAVGRRACIIDWGYTLLNPRLDDQGQPIYDPKYQPTLADRVRVMDIIAGDCRLGWARQHNAGERLFPVICAIDTGWHADEIYPWVETQPDWAAAKGVGSSVDGKKDVVLKEGTSLMTEDLAQLLKGVIDVTKPKTMTVELWHVLGSHVRQQLHSGLQRAVGGQGAVEIPLDLESKNYLLMHLTAEMWAADDKGIWKWREVRRRGNHLLDCATYALALGWYELAYRQLSPPPSPPGQVAPPPEQPPTPPERGTTNRERTHHTFQRRHSFTDR